MLSQLLLKLAASPSNSNIY